MSGISAVLEAATGAYLVGSRKALRDGLVIVGNRHNLDWVRPHLSASVTDDELLLRAGAPTSGRLLIVGKIPGAPIVGKAVARRTMTTAVR